MPASPSAASISPCFIYNSLYTISLTPLCNFPFSLSFVVFLYFPTSFFQSHRTLFEFLLLFTFYLPPALIFHPTSRELSYLFLNASPSPAPLTRCQLSCAFQLHHYIIIILYMQHSTLFNSRA